MKKLGLAFLFIVFVGFPVLLNQIDQKRQAQPLENFQEAKVSFEKGNFYKAAVCVDLSKTYSSLIGINPPKGIDKLEAKIKKAQALENFQEAQEFFDKGDIDLAEICLDLAESYGSRKGSSLPKGIKELRAKVNKAQALENFQKTKVSFEKRDFDGAEIYAYLSRVFSSRANVSPPKGIDELEDKIKKAQK